ncbi:MAG: DUF2088 domain-containing protein, partial [Candidatus Aminicenantes bacterium]|nr:DUF2088 domain-containing protein [Candidatus Aminicenantes bacterium]
MQIAIPYHQSHINLKIPDEIHVDAIFPNDVETDDQPEFIIQQLENPVNSVSLREFFKTADEVLFLINDATRPTPTARLLEMVVGLIKNKKAMFMVATGIHRLPSEMELRSILGRFYDRF